ncbi:MAG: SUMF1/EgtB/PvdO family nonheme iron enzyme [Elusimicrobiales bacterium]|nr:SUMF1/EgtB/PvdO family nonheme iron enzyme [Elusimicrobiales bacterium]
MKKAAKNTIKVSGAILGASLFIWPVSLAVAADLFPGYGSSMSAASLAAALPVKTTSPTAVLLAPVDGAPDISQSPALNVRNGYPAGGIVQYHFQVDTVQTMDSQSGQPQGSFDQTAAQLFSSSGAFSGQDTYIVPGSSDAYNSVSTATFVFYSGAAKLSPDTKYYWRARAKPAGGAYGAWSSTASFTTARFAVQNPSNHLAISGGSLSGNSGAVNIGFNIAENNVTTGTSAGGGAYNTADWVFVKFSTMSGTDGSWNHATLTGGSVGAGATLTAASDGKGVFLNHTANSAYWTSGATVTWNSAADGVNTVDVRVKVFAVSMVRVPQGPFIYNAGGIGGGASNNYGGGSAAVLSNASQLPAGAPAGWPNGYSGFYIGRYEITQGQYADFLNSIWSSTATALFYGSVIAGQNMTYSSGNPYGSRYAAVDPAAPKAMSYTDGWSYLSWAGLRPPTEMEWEKAGRDINGDARTYPWGDTAPGTVTYNPPNEGGACIRKFANYNNVAGCQKVLDVGRYLSGDVYRAQAETGASPWGIADLGGGVKEMVINCGWTGAVPANGSGTVSYPASWPAPGTAATGYRGGGYYETAASLRISARDMASFANDTRYTSTGGRGSRTP